MGTPLTSTVAEFIPNQRLAFCNSGPTVSAYHVWLIIPAADGCRVVSEKVDSGPYIAAASSSIREMLQSWVNRFKKVSESDHGGSRIANSR
jgi:hypothetical protein